MLKQRLFTALLLIPFVLILLLMPWIWPYQLVVSLVVFLALKEWITMLGGKGALLWFGSLAAPLLSLVLASYFRLSEVAILSVAGLGCLLLTLSWVEVGRYPKTWLFQHPKIAISYSMLLLMVFAYLLFAIKSIQPHCFFILSVLLLTWASDTGAYFAGRRWGNRKMAPQISPKKTIAGFWGGAFTTVGVGLLLGWAGLFSFSHLLLLVAFSFLIHVVAVLGDLFESVLKRHRQVKDSGQLLPGHGGMLDRIDSLLATLPMSIVLSFIGMRI